MGKTYTGEKEAPKREVTHLLFLTADLLVKCVWIKVIIDEL